MRQFSICLLALALCLSCKKRSSESNSSSISSYGTLTLGTVKSAGSTATCPYESTNKWNTLRIQPSMNGKSLSSSYYWPEYRSALYGRGFATTPEQQKAAKLLTSFSLTEQEISKIADLLCDTIPIDLDRSILFDKAGYMVGLKSTARSLEFFKAVAILPFINIRNNFAEATSRLASRFNDPDLLSEAKDAADQWLKDNPQKIGGAKLEFKETLKFLKTIGVAYLVNETTRKYILKYDPFERLIEPKYFKP